MDEICCSGGETGEVKVNRVTPAASIGFSATFVSFETVVSDVEVILEDCS